MTGTRRNPGRLRRLGPLVALGLVSAAVVAVPTGLGVTPPYSAFAGTTTATVTTTDTSDESGTINHLYANVGVDTGTVTVGLDRKSTRLNSSHVEISYAVFCLKKKK